MQFHPRIILPMLVSAGMALQMAAARASDLLPSPPPPPPTNYLPPVSLDLPEPPPPPPVYDPPPAYAPPPEYLPLRSSYGYEGAYIGVVAGGLCSDVTASVKVVLTKNEAQTSNGTFNGCSAHGGVLAGYNWSESNVVYGLEGDVTLSGNVLTQSDNGTDVAINMSTMRGRVGYEFDNMLLYATGGGALAWSSILGDTNTHLGWIVGGGAEYKVNQALGIRAEYLYANFGDKRYTRNINGTVYNSDIAFENTHLMRVGATWALNMPVYSSAPPPPPIPVPEPQPYVGVGG